MTDGHILIYHSSTIPMAVISKGDFVRRGFCPSYGGDFVHLVKIMWEFQRGLCPPCKKHEGDFVHLCKNEQRGFCPRGILSYSLFL